MRITLSFIILLLFSCSPTLSQWQLVAPNAVLIQSINGGVLTHVGNTLWAACTDVRVSTDMGISWQNRTPVGYPNNDIILSMVFLDGQTGVFGSLQGYMYRTLDAGMNWQRLDPFPPLSENIFDVTFMGSADRIACCTTAGYIYTTTDGGVTWKESSLADVTYSFAWKDGTLYAIGGESGVGSHLWKTSDFGQTWTKQPGRFDWDSYGLAVDSCSPTTFYVANEDIVSALSDRISSIYVSADEGLTWISKDPHPISYHCGSIQVSGKTVFTQTYEGLTRSRDKGISWKNIGGPPNRGDTRLFTAFSENLIFAVDSEGSVWRTNNSGGDSVIVDPVLLSPDTLFSGTSIFTCDDSVARTLRFVSPECNPRRITNSVIEGGDSLSYSIISTSDDSVSILFTPKQSRTYSATLVVKLSDGTERRVPMAGREIKPSLTLEKTYHTDTIGARISVPIIINGLDKPRDVEFVLHFDKGLVYKGTSLGAKTFDVAGTKTNTSSRIMISAADINLGSISAYANFLVYPDSASSWNVRFDSLSVPSLGVLCQDLTNSFPTTLTGPAGCGISALAHYVRTGLITLDRIIPNPTRGAINVVFTLPADDLVSFELVDMSGAILRLLRDAATFTTGSHLLHFNLDDVASGSYILRMRNATGYSLTQKFVNGK